MYGSKTIGFSLQQVAQLEEIFKFLTEPFWKERGALKTRMGTIGAIVARQEESLGQMELRKSGATDLEAMI